MSRRAGAATAPTRTRGGEPLDETPYAGVDKITITTEKTIKDLSELHSSILKGTMGMLTEISQQLVEIDNERKATAAQEHKELKSSTAQVIKTTTEMAAIIGVMEQEILEGQKHSQLMEAIELCIQASNNPNHDPVLDAIAQIPIVDLLPVQSEMRVMGDGHNKLHDSMGKLLEGHEVLHDNHSRMLEAIGGIEIPETDLRPLMQELGGIKGKHGELQNILATIHDSHSGLHDKNEQLRAILMELMERHDGLHSRSAEVINAIAGIKLEPTDIGPLMENIDELHGKHGDLHDLMSKIYDAHGELHSKHGSLQKAIALIKMPDMAPFHDHFGAVASFMNEQGSKATAHQKRLDALERSSQEQKQMLQTILQRLPEPVDKTVKGLQADIRAVKKASDDNSNALYQDLKTELTNLKASIQQQLGQNERDRVLMQQDTKRLHQATLDIQQQLHSTSRTHADEIIGAMADIPTGPDLDAIIDGVAMKLQRVTLKADTSAVLQALEKLPDLHLKLNSLHDKIQSSNIHYDPSDVLRAINDIKPGPTHDIIASAVHDKLTKATMKVDNSEVLRALGDLDLDRVLSGHMDMVHGKLGKHQGELIRAIGNMPNHDGIANSLASVLEKNFVNVDLGEMRNMLALIPTGPDHDAIAHAVHDRIGDSLRQAGDHSRIIDTIAELNLSPDNTVMLEAIEAMEENMLRKILDAVAGIEMNVKVQGLELADITATPENPRPGRGRTSVASTRSASTSQLPGAASSTSQARSTYAWDK